MRFAKLIRSSVAAAFLVAGLTHAQLIRQANTSLTLPADLPSATGYAVENALGTLSFTAPMLTTFPAGETNRLFVAERAGTIQVVTNLSTTPTKAAYFSLSSLLGTGETLRTDGENGFLSLVFHPNFATNRTFYVYFSLQKETQLHQRLHQVTVTSATANTATIAQQKPLLTILDRDTNHNGGDLHFGADGFLYLSTGDEGGANDTRNNARHLNHLIQTSPVAVQRTGFWGQMLRLAVEVDPVGQPGVFPPGVVAPNTHVQASTAFPSALHGNYRVPADNPFHGYTLWHSVAIDPATVRTEIWATGLRNPFRWSFDPVTGRLFLGDVGQNAREEVNIVAKGDDLGWSWREGAIAFTSSPAYPDNRPGNTNAAPAAPAPGSPPGTGFSPKAPIYDYDRTDNGTPNDPVVFGTTVTGGIVYRGSRLTELYGKYLFAEYGQGMIVALTEGTGGAWTGQRLAIEAGIVDFGYDPRDGDALLTDLGNGRIWRLARTGTSGTDPPALLSQTGAFANLANLTPQTGLVPYDPNVPFWSDYAIKSRWFAIKNLTDTIGFSADGNWTFPTGMIWVKHFDIELERGNPATRRKLETRFLVKTASDVYGLSYKWRADQSDADLVAEGGLTEAIAGSSPAQTWRFPSRVDCRACHTPAGGFALSFNTRQLNRTRTYDLQTPNQLSALSAAGYFSTVVADVHTLPAFARADDTSQSLEWRVRSYLAVNCVQCHQPGGAAQGSWDARITTPTDLAGLINGALVNNGGNADARFAVPGDAPAFGQATHSMVLRRIRGDGAQRMPPLGTNERDLAAETLLTAWITQELPTRQSFAEWQVAQFGSSGATGAGATDDPDGDGENNRVEFLRRTNPRSPTLPFSPVTTVVGPNLQLSFPQVPGRSLLIETSTDLVQWSLWNVPGNSPDVPAAAGTRTLTAPLDAQQRFFRGRISLP